MTKSLTNKNILLGITGGIAAYKSAELARRLREAGANVRVVMTDAAQEFITPLTLQAVSGHPVHTSLLDPNEEAAMGHIALARWADLVCVAPASANFLSKLAQGQANDLLSALCLATQAPIAVAPAMNQQMWHDEATQVNIRTLMTRGVHIFGPATGEQACGEFGPGRMLEPSELVTAMSPLFHTGALTGVKVVITAGPTREYLDPIRFISNPSTGKMGYAMAQAAIEAGAETVLISGPVTLTPPSKARTVSVITAEEMQAAVMKEITPSTVFIGVAAVGDFRAEVKSHQKISKSQMKGNLTISLVPNPDIIAGVAAQAPRPFVVGFSAQLENVAEDARRKLREKSLDLVVANQVGLENNGFGSDDNEVTVYSEKKETFFPRASKEKLARALIQFIAQHYDEKNSA